MRWLIFICFTFSIYTILVLINNFLSKYGYNISPMGVGAVGGVLASAFFNWLCHSKVCLEEDSNKKTITVDKQTYKSTLNASMNYWAEIEVKTDKIKKLEKQLNKAERILVEISNIGKKSEYKKMPWLKYLVESYFDKE